MLFIKNTKTFECLLNSVIAEANLPLDRLTTLCAQMTKATNDFRRCINEAKELHVRQIEKMQQERDAALLAARVHEDGDDPNHMNQIPGMEMPPAKKVKHRNRLSIVIKSIMYLNNPIYIVRQLQS